MAQALVDQVVEFFARHLALNSRLVVALSGGMDSVTLLHIMSGQRARLGGILRALHVHHGISAHADQWAEFCQSVCDQWQIPLRIEQVMVRVAPGESLEEQARLRRYECFEREDADAIVLAHHLDDQCETFFLRLLRGSGLRGLSGMAHERPLHRGSAVRVLRPLLGISRAHVEAYARVHALTWVEDDSNQRTNATRNFLRLEVLPLIASRFPGYRLAIERAAQNLCAVDQWVDQRASIDLQSALRSDVLRVDVLRHMDAERALLVLRAYLEGRVRRPPPRAWLEEALRQCLQARQDAQVRMALQEGALCRYRDGLHWVPACEEVGVSQRLPWQVNDSLTLPAGLGQLRIVERTGEGLSRTRLGDRRCTVRFATRSGRMQLASDRPSRTLKNLYQENAIPPWERDRIPLLFGDEEVLWAGRLGYDCRARARAGEPGLCIEWMEPGATGPSVGE